MVDPLSIRAAGPGDWDEAGSVTSRAMGEERDGGFVHWKYWERPEGRGLLLLAESEGQIIATCGAVPIRLQYGADTFPVWMITDDGVLPGHRGQGVFSALGRRRLEILMSTAAVGIWGFCTPMSHHTQTARFGMAELGLAPWFWAPIPALDSMVLSRLTRRAMRGHSGEPPPPVDAARAVALFEEIHRSAQWMSKGMLRLCKDQQYLQWRYLTHPTNQYRFDVHATEDAVIIRRGRSVVDIAAATARSAWAALRKTLHLMAREGHSDCYMYFQGPPDLQAAMKDTGFWSHRAVLAKYVERARVASPRWLVARTIGSDGGLPMTDAKAWLLATGDHGEMA